MAATATGGFDVTATTMVAAATLMSGFDGGTFNRVGGGNEYGDGRLRRRQHRRSLLTAVDLGSQLFLTLMREEREALL
jgi:hypothetical protein